MPKRRNIPWKPQKGKVYLNSECEKCGCYLCELKYKEDVEMILCRKCYTKIYKAKLNESK